jgi:hypothetical protein
MPASGDYNNDGLQDVLWRDSDGNRFAISLMNGTRVLEQGPLLPGPPGTGWVLVNGVADFNFDGMSDLLWWNQITNRMTVWIMRGTVPIEQGPEIPGPPGEDWICIQALDFNFDGFGDVLWHNPTTNRMAVWLMRSTEPFEKGPEIPGPGRGWFAGVGADFDGDGIADVLWFNTTTARMAVWLMEGTLPRDKGPELPIPSGAEWILASPGEFNRDLMTDLAWFNTTTKRATISLMRGTRLLEQGAEFPAPPGEGWIYGNAADTNGDGITDTVWLGVHPLRMMVSLMNSALPMESGPVIPGPDCPHDAGP